jgi:hypothetical protein
MFLKAPNSMDEIMLAERSLLVIRTDVVMLRMAKAIIIYRRQALTTFAALASCGKFPEK